MDDTTIINICGYLILLASMWVVLFTQGKLGFDKWVAQKLTHKMNGICRGVMLLSTLAFFGSVYFAYLTIRYPEWTTKYLAGIFVPLWNSVSAIFDPLWNGIPTH